MLSKSKDIRIKKIIKESLEEAYKADLNDNKLKSAKFVECFGTKLFNEFYPPDERLKKTSNNWVIKKELKVQRVNEDGTGKLPGEWLLDIVIAEYIEDPEICISNVPFVKKILWAVESESDTSIKAMADDFGKLAVVNADNYVYLNGINQDSDHSVERYIDRRIRTVNKILKTVDDHFKDKELYYAFWPSPGKTLGRESYWEIDLNTLAKRVRVYKIDIYELVEIM